MISRFLSVGSIFPLTPATVANQRPRSTKSVLISIRPTLMTNTGVLPLTGASLSIEVARPILTVHGIFSNSSTWEQPRFNWRQIISDMGLPYASISMHENGGVGLDSIADNAADIENRVNTLLARWGVDRINIVAHSKGGLDSRDYAEKHDTIEQIVQLGTPNAGSPLADAAQAGAVLLIGGISTVILDGLAAPAGAQLTTAYMSIYNLFHGRNQTTQYVSVAGDYRFGGWGVVDTELLVFFRGRSDTVVPVWSVHSLGYATHLTAKSTGDDSSAMHTSLTSAGSYIRLGTTIYPTHC